ncbi:hypothetical protein [Solirubrobacter soli]|uniref:hypothetical protein n=1 Tax=Solirubrobacter soli TaxID=363832 RepID=UPI000414A611|nr:hypothetical protein [Solirubrobacter soli]
MRLLLAAALALALTPAAQAKPVSLPYSEDFLAIAYGSGHALVAEPEPYGAHAIVIRDLAFAQRTDHVLLEVPYAGKEPDVALAANAGGYLVASDGHVVLGGYDGSQKPVLDCAGLPRLAAGGAGFAVAGQACGTVIVGADGTVTPVDGVTPDDLAYAEPFLARRFDAETVVRNLATGVERRVATPETDSIALASDGALLAVTSDGLFAEGALLSNRAAGDVAAAGGRVLFDTLATPRVVPLGGGTAHALSLPGAGLASVLGFDGVHAAFQSFSCQGARQVTEVAVDEPREAGQIGACPVRIAADRLRFSHDGRATARVTCPNGCRATLELVEQSTESRTIATARLDLPAAKDRHAVAFHLTRAGRALRGRRVEVRISTRGGLGLTFEGEISRAVLKR